MQGRSCVRILRLPELGAARPAGAAVNCASRVPACRGGEPFGVAEGGGQVGRRMLASGPTRSRQGRTASEGPATLLEFDQPSMRPLSVTGSPSTENLPGTNRTRPPANLVLPGN
jgi:hypothetical protein